MAEVVRPRDGEAVALRPCPAYWAPTRARLSLSSTSGRPRGAPTCVPNSPWPRRGRVARALLDLAATADREGPAASGTATESN
jgi:hypothetical protein